MTLDQLSDLFDSAIQIEDPQQQVAFIETSSADPSDQQRLLELVAAHRRHCKILDSSHALTRIARDVENRTVKPQTGDAIGHYQLLQQIGEGGMGRVFMAEQFQPIRRRVALKIMKTDLKSGLLLARFEAEREALSRLNHPGITRILDAGVTDQGKPYFVMDLVEGESLTEYCNRHQLTISQRIELLEKVCVAVHHAHQKGIIHRDIKPSNILVTQIDGVAHPKVIDFGIAKALDRPLTELAHHTRDGDLLGTPQYMSPEQTEKAGVDLDLRTDVYSLGVVMYELLTGTTPLKASSLQGKGILKVLEAIRDVQAEPPSVRARCDGAESLRSHSNNHLFSQVLSGDLDAITLKAIANDREARYDSAASLGNDLRSYLRGEPVKATPPTLSYLARKMYRKHRMMCLMIAASVILLIVTTGLSLRSAILNAQLKTLATQRADDLLFQSLQLQQLNDELIASRDRARLAETQALSLANDMRRQAATERANSRYLHHAGIFATDYNGQIFINSLVDWKEYFYTLRLSRPKQFPAGAEDAGDDVELEVSGEQSSIPRPQGADQIINMGAVLDHSQNEQEAYFDFLVEEMRKEFGSGSTQVAQTLLDAGFASLNHSSPHWSKIETQAREALATFLRMPSKSTLYLELQAHCLLYRALKGQGKVSEADQRRKNIALMLNGARPDLTTEQTKFLFRLLKPD